MDSGDFAPTLNQLGSEMFKPNKSIGIFVAVGLIAATAFNSVAQEQGQAAKLSPQQNEIKKLTEQFVAAFNQGDAKSIAARWAENGEMNIDGDDSLWKGQNPAMDAGSAGRAGRVDQ
jgi:hypothetical protein